MRAPSAVTALGLLAACALTSCATAPKEFAPYTQSVEARRLLKSVKASLGFQNTIVVVSLEDLEDDTSTDTVELRSRLIVWGSNQANDKPSRRKVLDLAYVGDLQPKVPLLQYPATYTRDGTEERWNFCLRLTYKEDTQCLYGFVLTDKTTKNDPLGVVLRLVPEGNCAECDNAPP
jgi:hypothetical protein